MLPVFVGHDCSETAAHLVTVRSLLEASTTPLAIVPLVEAHLRGLGLYTRPHQQRGPQLYDAASGVPLSTSFSLGRFCAPMLAHRYGWRTGWAIYCDGDMLWRRDPVELLDLAEDRFAVMVVQHPEWTPADVKKSGALQRAYPRKGWSSLALWNLGHPGTWKLEPEALAVMHPDQLHAFAWLNDREIGRLPRDWNWMPGVSANIEEPAVVHYTLGTPDRGGAGDAPFADEWRGMLSQGA